MSILENFLETSNAAKTPEAVFEEFNVAIHKLGFDICGYFLLDPAGTNNKEPHKIILTTEGTEHLAEEYASKSMAHVDASQLWSAKTGQITSWHEESALEKYPEYEPFLKYLHENNLTSGVSIPLYGVGNEMAYLDLANYHKSGPIDIESPEVKTVRLMAYQMNERIRSMVKKETTSITLSPREKEVLQWIMNGKSDSVIADIMTISEHTVGTYIKRTYQKLNVSNRVAAVVKAINLGLISP